MSSEDAPDEDAEEQDEALLDEEEGDALSDPLKDILDEALRVLYARGASAAPDVPQPRRLAQLSLKTTLRTSPSGCLEKGLEAERTAW